MNMDRPSNAHERYRMSDAEWRPDPTVEGRSRYRDGARWTPNGAEPSDDQSIAQADSAVEPDSNTDVGEAFVDAFYAFDAGTIGDLLTDSDSEGLVLFYRGWAEGANYAVVERGPCETVSATEIRCSITVEDDFGKALGPDFNVTDTFDITLDQSGAIDTVSLSSDDPPEVQAALDGVYAAQPELFGTVCEGFFDGGPTPGECARAFVESFETSAGQPPDRPGFDYQIACHEHVDVQWVTPGLNATKSTAGGRLERSDRPGRRPAQVRQGG